MEVLLLILAAALMLVGLAGAILPVIPGPPISFLGLLVLHFSSVQNQLESESLIWAGGFAVVITVLDYLVPIWGAKKLGGSRYGMIGSTLGLLIGLLMGPMGMILGPFVGAVLGELAGGKNMSLSIRSGLGTFLGFLIGTVLKLVYAAAVLGIFISSLFAN